MSGKYREIFSKKIDLWENDQGRFLGHVIAADGIRTSPEKTESGCNLACAQNCEGNTLFLRTLQLLSSFRAGFR